MRPQKKIFIWMMFFIAIVVLGSHANAAFQDVDQDHPNREAIEFLQQNSIVDGYPDGFFRPASNINRAEFVKIIIEASQPAQSQGGFCFPDVKEEWFAPYICTAKWKGIISGYPDGAFKPTQNINFVEAAKIISMSFSFETLPNEIWFIPFIDALAKRNAMPETIDNIGRPITRGEMAEMIYRLKSELPAKEISFPNHANEKKLSLYSSKEAFLVSDEDWRAVSTLNPAVNWTDNRGEIHKSPLLIFHQEGDLVETLSVKHFLNQYDTQKISTFSNLPNHFNAELTEKYQINQIQSPHEYWESFKDIVYVEDNYELGIFASVYASLINAPLLIKGYNDNFDFSNRNVICLGNSLSPCNESYDLPSLQQKYIRETSSNKLIIVNPIDNTNSLTHNPSPEFGNVRNLFGNLSLSAIILASTKHELIIFTHSNDFSTIDNDIKTKIVEFQPEYLTIIASPHVIPVAQLTDNRRQFIKNLFPESDLIDWKQVDSAYYADLDGDFYQDIAIGRIFGFTVSDTSAYIARVLFYNELNTPNNVSTLTSFVNMFAQPLHENLARGNFFKNGFHIISAENSMNENMTKSMFNIDYENQSLISYSGHSSGNFTEGGFDTYSLRNSGTLLKNPIIIISGCANCSFNSIEKTFNGDLSMLMCAELIRRGAIGYIGATDTSYQNASIENYFLDKLTKGFDMGTAFKEANNIYFVDSNREYNPFLILLGDPTFNPDFNFSQENTVELLQSNINSLESNSFSKKINIRIKSQSTIQKENIRNGDNTKLFVNTPPAYTGENVFISNVNYFKTTKIDSTKTSGFELESSMGDLKVFFKFNNPKDLKLKSIANARIQYANDSWQNMMVSFDPDNQFDKDVFTFTKNNTTWVLIRLDLNQDRKMVDQFTTSTPQISIEIDFEFVP